MAKPIRIDIDLVKGDVGEIKFIVKTKKNRRKVPVDLSIYDKIQLGFYLNKKELIIIEVDKNDTVNNNLQKGIIYFQIPISVTKKFIPDEIYEYDVQLVKGSDYRKTIIRGNLKIIDEINVT